MEGLTLHGWELLFALFLSFAGSVWFGHIVIPVLQGKKVGQTINEAYIAEHKGKNGTPTMGGVSFILVFLLLALPFAILLRFSGDENLISFALTVALGVANAFIGFFDDYCKLCHRRNEGLKSWQKFLLQIAVAVVYVVALHRLVGLDRTVSFRLLQTEINLGWAYDPLAVLVIVGVVNATNLTDGIDGLASSLTVVAAGALALLGCVAGNAAGTVTGVLLAGCLSGFLVYNYHPAKVFMGDTGSLFIGGILIGIGFQTDSVLPALVICGVFILDMLTSLIQILSIRLLHRKVFPIAPVHHAFQKAGWNEEKIVYVFTAMGLLLGFLAVLSRILSL